MKKRFGAVNVERGRDKKNKRGLVAECQKKHSSLRVLLRVGERYGRRTSLFFLCAA